MVIPYVAGSDGEYKTEKPGSCPQGLEDGTTCTVAVKYYRSRKTGPEIRLLVVGCENHGIYFTIYPPGYSPYSRGKWAPVAEDGSLISDEGVKVAQESDAFEATLFSAAIDAARGEKWPESLSPLDRGEGAGIPKGVFQTQKRQIKLFSRLFGLESCSEKLQHAAAEELGISALELRDYAATIRAGPTYRSRAAGIKKILQNLPSTPQLAKRIYKLGSLFGFWGSAHMWTPPPQVLMTSGLVP